MGTILLDHIQIHLASHGFFGFMINPDRDKSGEVKCFSSMNFVLVASSCNSLHLVAALPSNLLHKISFTRGLTLVVSLLLTILPTLEAVILICLSDNHT